MLYLEKGTGNRKLFVIKRQYEKVSLPHINIKHMKIQIALSVLHKNFTGQWA